MVGRLWKYNDWANNLLFGAFVSNQASMPVSCLRLLSHIVCVQAIWVSRINGEPAPYGPWDLLEAEACKKLHGDTEELIKMIMEKDNHDPDIPVFYRNRQGQDCSNAMSDILIHMFNHGTYHRGQIALEMRRAGLEPVATDYSLFVSKS